MMTDTSIPKRPCVLVVDDEASLLMTLAANLELEGFEVMEAANARSALEIVAAQPVDLVLTDVRMPGMSGVELFRELRLLKPDLPVVLMTAFAAEGLVEQALSQGAFTLLSKPFAIERMVSTLLRAVRRPAVLIVDGERAAAIAAALSGAGVRAEATSSADEALAAAQGGLADVCVVPLGAGRTDGDALIRRLASCEPPLPVIAIAGPSVADLAERMQRMHAVTFLREPVDVAALARLIAHTRGVQRGAPLGASSPAAG